MYVSVMTGFETSNKYQVKNVMGQQVFFAGEGIFHLCAENETLCVKFLTNTRVI